MEAPVILSHDDIALVLGRQMLARMALEKQLQQLRRRDAGGQAPVSAATDSERAEAGAARVASPLAACDEVYP